VGCGTGQETRTLQGHTDWVSSVAFSADGKRLASGSEDQLTEWHAARELGERQRDEAQARLDLLLAGARAEDLEASRAALARLEARRPFLRELIGRTRLVSPIAGLVTTRRLKEKRGGHVRPGDFVAEVQALEHVRVEISVPEKEIGDVRPDHPVCFKARAYPERTFAAQIDCIAPTAHRPADREAAAAPTVFLVTRVDNDGLLLKPGMTGKAKVYCGERRIFDLVARRLARLVRVEFWSWW
jgi:multidrug resistance efflux pump